VSKAVLHSFEIEGQMDVLVNGKALCDSGIRHQAPYVGSRSSFEVVHASIVRERQVVGSFVRFHVGSSKEITLAPV